jgi:hypothetical protein
MGNQLRRSGLSRTSARQMSPLRGFDLQRRRGSTEVAPAALLKDGCAQRQTPNDFILQILSILPLPYCATLSTPKSVSRNWRGRPGWAKSPCIGCSPATATPPRATWVSNLASNSPEKLADGSRAEAQRAQRRKRELCWKSLWPNRMRLGEREAWNGGAKE